MKAHIALQQQAKPAFWRLQKPLEEKLDHLENQGILTTVAGLLQWFWFQSQTKLSHCAEIIKSASTHRRIPTAYSTRLILDTSWRNSVHKARLEAIGSR